MSNRLGALAAWLSDLPVRLDMAVSGRTHEAAAVVVQDRRARAASARQERAVTRQNEIAVRKQQQIDEQAVRTQQIAEQRAYEERCARESYYRRVAIDSARHEAVVIVNNLGYTTQWADAPWFEAGRTERLKHRSALIEKYMGQILGFNNPSPMDQMRKQMAFGDASFAQGAQAQAALSGRSGAGVNELSFTD